MSIREEQCNKVCRTLDDVLANRPTERDSLIIAVRKAFESLEQLGNSEQLPSAQPDHIGEVTEMVGDAVSRQGVLRLLNAVPSEEFVTKAMLISGVNALPSAQRWIPWGSGKFPEESGTYTVTAYDGATKRVTYAKYQKRLKRWELTGARAYWRVLAWMEKPKPWEGGQS